MNRGGSFQNWGQMWHFKKFCFRWAVGDIVSTFSTFRLSGLIHRMSTFIFPLHTSLVISTIARQFIRRMSIFSILLCFSLVIPTIIRWLLWDRWSPIIWDSWLSLLIPSWDGLDSHVHEYPFFGTTGVLGMGSGTGFSSRMTPLDKAFSSFP